MDKKITSFLLLLLFSTLLSCEEEVIFAFEHEQKLVLDCILNPDSIVSGKLTLSQSISEKQNIVVVDKGVIKLYEDEILFGTLKGLGDGRYRLDKRPNQGKKYRIIAELENHLTLTAETTIPRRPKVKYQKSITDYPTADTTIYTYNLEVQLKDEVGKSNYWIYQKYTVNGVNYGNGITEINAPFLDGFNKTVDQDSRYGYRLFMGVRLSDEGFDGQLMEFVIPGFYAGRDRNYQLFFSNADEHYDKHIKTTIINRMKETSELPFFEPVQIYSNIENGYGIFGSCCIASFNLEP